MLLSFKRFNEQNEIELKLDDPIVEPGAPEGAPKPSEDKYDDIVKDLKSMVNETGNYDEIIKKADDANFEISSLGLKNFSQDSDVYDFYLKHQFSIDEKLNELKFFSNTLDSFGISKLYDAVIVGTQMVVQKFLQEMK